MRWKTRMGLGVLAALVGLLGVGVSSAAAQTTIDADPADDRPGNEAITGLKVTGTPTFDEIAVEWVIDGAYKANCSADADDAPLPAGVEACADPNRGDQTPLTGVTVYYSTKAFTDSRDAGVDFVAATTSGIAETATKGTATLKKLTPNTPYYVRAAAVNDRGTGEVTEAISPRPKTAEAPKPEIVTGVDVTPGDESLVVTWDPAHPDKDSSRTNLKIAMYHVQYRASQTATTSVGDWMPTTPMKVLGDKLTTPITGLTNGTSYDVQVQAENNTKAKGAWSPQTSRSRGTPAEDAMPATTEDEDEEEEEEEETTPTTDTDAGPAAPMGVSAVAGDKMVTVSWEAVTGATGYMVQYRTAAQSYSMTMRMKEAMATATSAMVDGLVNGTEYMFQVRAKNADGYGDASMEVEQTPKAMPKSGPQPTAVYLTPLERNKIRVDWQYKEEPSVAGASTSTSFQIGWTDATGTVFADNVLSPQVTKKVGRSDRHSVLEGLKVDQSYLVAVRAIHSDGAGGTIKSVPADWRYRETPASARRESTPGKVKVPQNLNVTAGDSELMVTWDADVAVGMCKDAAAGAHCGYLVEWRAAHQGFDNPDRQMHVRDKTSYTITGLMNGTEYGVRVKAGNERMKATKGYGEPSVEARQTPMMPTPALPVFGVLALGAGLVAAGRRRLRARRQPRLLKP